MSESLIVILSIVTVVIILVIMYFSYNNKEIALRKEAEAQLGKIETVRDRMFQIVRDTLKETVSGKSRMETNTCAIYSSRYHGLRQERETVSSPTSVTYRSLRSTRAR